MYSVFIRKNSTGEIREYVEPYEWHDGSEYLWTDGNYACDCNLELFFLRAGQEPEPAIMDTICGDTRFTPLYALLQNGKKIHF